MNHAVDEARPRQGVPQPPGSAARRRLGRRISWTLGIRRQTLVGWLFVLPALIMYGLFVLQPLALTVQYSFYRWDGVGPATWVGLANYTAVLSEPKLVETLFNAFRLVLFYSLIPVTLGLVTASDHPSHRKRENGDDLADRPSSSPRSSRSLQPGSSGVGCCR